MTNRSVSSRIERTTALRERGILWSMKRGTVRPTRLALLSLAMLALIVVGGGLRPVIGDHT
ncbi:MAG TPA: hypothetical protein VJX67_20675, partial [Blastocatellia bacterium]|nr:hypothetical protein [Blastocatellia bacterium]